jgi:hypothetical protein
MKVKFVAQAVRRQPLTKEAQIQFQVNPYAIFGGQRVTVRNVSLPSTSLPPVSIVPPTLHTSYQYCSYQKDKRAKPGNLKIQQCPVRYRPTVTVCMLQGVHKSFLQFRIFYWQSKNVNNADITIINLPVVVCGC